MGETALSNIPPNDHLNRRLLIRELGGDKPLVSLLEHLCTDSVYVLKDDFDKGIDNIHWVNGGFTWGMDVLHGKIFGGLPTDEDEDRDHSGLFLRSRIFGWQPGHRAVAMIRLTLGGLSGIVEFGFVDEYVVNAPGGVVASKATPSATSAVTDFTLATRDADDNAFYGIVARGRDNAIGSGTNSKAVAISGSEHTLMLVTNEQTESRLWVDGMYTDIEYSGPSRYAKLAIWLHADRSPIDVDYIQAWQERSAV